MAAEENPVQRYMRYVKAADEARRSAVLAENKDAAEVYLRIAASWQAVADEMTKGGLKVPLAP